MAIQGIFLADFSQYNAAVDGADAKLRKFTSSTTSHDTASRQFNSTTDRGTNSFGQLSQGLATADKTLAAFGVHIGPEVRALEELSTASGKTATQLGIIGTASLAAAAALGGFRIGQLINDFTGLDEAFSRWIDRTFDLAVAQQEAGAKQDVLDRATQNAKRTITDYNEAIQINITAEKNRITALGERATAEKKAADETEKALEKERAATAAYAKELQGIQDRMLGDDQIKKAQDYMRTFIDVGHVAGLNVTALGDFNQVLFDGIVHLQEQGNGMGEMAMKMREWQAAVIAAQDAHSVAFTTMETDEERLKRENDELAKAMQENFVIIGQSAQEVAQKVSLSFSTAMDAVRAGQGTMGGTFQSIAPGAPGSSIRYDDYGNPYGYIPGVNNPGKISPTGGGGGASVFVDARESFFDSQAGAQRLADKVVTALGTRVASQGGR